MNRYEVTLQFDYPFNEDISFLSDEIANAINTWGSYENITVTNASQVSISPKEAIKQIEDCIKKNASYGCIESEKIMNIIAKVN
jgi:hypothetical protein